ncbi:hypothetical protein C1645_816311 [Glomus cerebriforme]|uniref:Uncharacterized protein n=1 Tax=Glomus cerebriforme TaxID=658196 RepID=A0A397TBU1_9GLOM|nr:hypothetical protein C1645_816311 [Glomus cerebriforme]
MDINFASANSTFDNLDPYVLSSTKEEMDARKGNFSIVTKNKKKEFPKVFFIDLEDYRKNGAEEQSRKGNLRTISSAIQLPLHDQLSPPKEPLHDQPSPPKERSQEKDKGIHITETGEISFLAPRTTSSMDNYDGESQQTSNSNQCFLESRPGEDYQCCIWCVNFSSQRDKGRNSFIPTKHRPIPSSSGTKWRCDFKDRSVGNSGIVRRRMPGLPYASSEQIFQSRLEQYRFSQKEFHEFHDQLKYEWIIDQENKEYFSDAYGITNINPLLVDNYGMTVLFLDSREKKLKIMEDTGKMVPVVELKRQAKEIVEAQLANLKRE